MSHSQTISADEALRRLKNGNERFFGGKAHLAGSPLELVARLAREGQRPFATILGCSDSRAPPEWIFDAGLGELFVIRVAGNVLSPEIAGSLQYAGAHLGIPLVVVLGHEGCGAVQAALDTKYAAIQQPSRIQLLVESILPALDGLDPQAPPALRSMQAVEDNVRWTVRAILASPEGRLRVAEGRMRAVGAIYDIHTGRVRFIDTE